MIGYNFLTAGKATFTLEVPAEFAATHRTAAHYTYRVTFKKGNGSYRDAYFVALLSGPDNDNDYTYMGMMNGETGEFRSTTASKIPANSMPAALFARVATRLAKGEEEAIVAAGFKLHHEGQCGRCGKTLTVPESVASGFGPECVKRAMGCRAVY